MPRNRPNKRAPGKSANKDAPAAQKSKTTAEATTASAKGKGDAASTSDEQIVGQTKQLVDLCLRGPQQPHRMNR